MQPEGLASEIEKATAAHEAWKVKLREAAQSGVLPKPASDIACDDQCSFGKWLYRIGQNKEVASSVHYRLVVARHADFHAEAGRVAGMIEAGAMLRAEVALDGPALSNASARLVDAMAHWRAHV